MDRLETLAIAKVRTDRRRASWYRSNVAQYSVNKFFGGIALIGLITGCASAVGPLRSPQTRRTVAGRRYQVADLKRSLVHIRIRTADATAPKTGTAFIVNVLEGTAYILTAHHVVRPKGGDIVKIQIDGEGIDPLTLDAWAQRLVAEDESRDLALFTATARPNAVAVQLQHPEANLSSLRDTVALGYAGVGGEGERPSITEKPGSVAWNERDGSRLLTTTADVLPSMSGGPVLSFRTQAVIGVVRGRTTTEPSERLITPVSLFMGPLRDFADVSLLRQVTPYNLPRPLPYLVRRPSEEASLHKRLNERPAPFIVITGDGGTGKTVLATTIAYDRLDPSKPEHGEKSPDKGYPDGVYFIEVKNLAEGDVLGRLYTAVTGTSKPPTAVPSALVQEVRQLFAGRRALVILDDLRDRHPPALLMKALSDVPVLATSRRRYRTDGIQTLELTKLRQEQAQELLRNLVGKDRLKDADAASLATRLGLHPLALAIAGAAMRQLGLSAASMRTRLDRNGAAGVLKDFFQKDGNPAHRSAVEAFLVSWHMLQSAERSALAGLVQAADTLIPRALAQQLAGPDDGAQTRIDALVALNLATYDEAENVTIHPLTHELTRAVAKEQADDASTQARNRMVAHLQKVGTQNYDREVHKPYGPHVTEATRHLSRTDLKAAEQLLLRWDDALDWSGHWTERIAAWQGLEASARSKQDEERLAPALNMLGIAFNALGRREAALEATAEAVKTYRRLAEARPDAFLPDLAMSLNNLGREPQRVRSS